MDNMMVSIGPFSLYTFASNSGPTTRAELPEIVNTLIIKPYDFENTKLSLNL